MALVLWGELLPRALQIITMSKQQKANYTKYAGIGFQLIILCLIFVLGGKWLDAYFEKEQMFLLIGIFISVFTVMYLLIKKLK